MEFQKLTPDIQDAVDAALGYLNFSAGASDTSFLSSLNRVFGSLTLDLTPDEADKATEPRPWSALRTLFDRRLDALAETSPAFADAGQARSVIALTHDHVLDAYREFHRDLLFHQSESFLFNSFFLGRCYEAVLQCREEAAGDDEQLVRSVLQTLNDYVGYRPVATLESKPKLEPHPHERCRPLPVFIKDVGAAFGPYEEILTRCIEILKTTDPSILDQAHFDLDRIDELAIDPRSYDFDHPVNKRPNYQFGQWDPHQIDNQGFYRRFVVQQLTIDSLLQRIETNTELPREELVFEASAALAGILLMSSAVSGYGPEAHSSDVTLSTLLPQIAAFRDSFYENLLAQNKHSRRLFEEAQRLKQPFGGVRQHLNSRLSYFRASQLEHVHLARVYARIGYPHASAHEANMVPTASARMTCMIQCLITEAQFQLDEGRVASAAIHLPRIVDLLHRGIECGAIVDPWNILGFDGNFSLFPSLENSIHDHRIDELLELMEELFALFARCLCLAAATDENDTAAQVANGLDEISHWWDQFAVSSVSSISGVDAGPLRMAAGAAADALAAWHSAGETAGDVGFWQPHVADFDSPKAYSLVLDALLDRHDYVASMALLMHWLSQADRIPLQKGSDWFHNVAWRWLESQLDLRSGAADDSKSSGDRLPDVNWPLVIKFFDYLEANADVYWNVPQFEAGTLLGPEADESDAEPEVDDETDEDGLFAAAYEDVVYHDTTDDGVDSELLGDGIADMDDYALDHEVKRISDRLAFLLTVARLWKRTAQVLLADGGAHRSGAAPVEQRLSTWLQRVLENRSAMLELLRRVARHQIPRPDGQYASMVEYDRRRMVKESLLERIVSCCIGCCEAAQFLVAVGAEVDGAALDDDMAAISEFLRATLAGDIDQVRQLLPELQEVLGQHTLLYVPVSRGGDAVRLVETRTRQRALRLLLALLPRQGLLTETVQLLETCAEMEENRTVGPGAVTEFDQLFKIGHQAMAECIVASSRQWNDGGQSTEELGDDSSRYDDGEDPDLVEFLQHLTEVMMQRWLAHSRTLRLSVLERVSRDKSWQKLSQFISDYGGDLFNQAFFNIGNLRAILHEGVDWLDDQSRFKDASELSVLAAYADSSKRQQIVSQLQLIMEAIVENYVEYRDYNGTTTQSDRGEMLYTLLDMLRLRVSYDRVAWNLTPLVLTHEVLVRQRRTVAADIWRNEMFTRTREMSDDMVRRLRDLERQYGMRLSTVADRIGERFVKPLQIDRICALVRPAMAEARWRDPSAAAFSDLQEHLTDLTREPTGVGLDLPPWLEILEEEVELARQPHHYNLFDEAALLLPQRALSRHDSQEQLEAL